MELRPLLCAILSIAVLATSELASAQESAPRSRSSILGSYNSPVFLSAGKVVNWNLEFLFEKDHLLVKHGGSWTKFSYSLDPSMEPMQITMIRTDGSRDMKMDEPLQINAIYEQSQKEIRIAFLPGPNDGSSLEERPKDMRSSDANQAIVMILTQKDSSIK